MFRDYLKVRVIISAYVLLLLLGCAVEQPPPAKEVLEKTLPETTQIPEEWVGPADSGKVDDGWLNGFKDQRLNELVAEVLENNQNLRVAAAHGQRTIEKIDQ